MADMDPMMPETAEHEPYPLQFGHVVCTDLCTPCVCDDTHPSVPFPVLNPHTPPPPPLNKHDRTAASTSTPPTSWAPAAWSARAAGASSVRVYMHAVCAWFGSNASSHPPFFSSFEPARAVEEEYEEEQALAGSPPKMLPPPFPMNPAGAAAKTVTIPLNNPPMPTNEEQGQGAGAGKAVVPPPSMPEQGQQQQMEGSA